MSTLQLSLNNFNEFLTILNKKYNIDDEILFECIANARSCRTHCCYMFKSGVKQGLMCKKKTGENQSYCNQHTFIA